jgi:hypothetical protein
MAYSVPLFSTLNNEGVDLNTAFTFYTTGGSTSDQAYPTPPLSLGQTVLGTLNGKWVLCTAATGTITKYDVVSINNTFTATPTPATATYGLIAGVAMATATTGQALWIQTNGVTPGINTAAGVAANVLLYTSAVTGRADDTASGFTRLQGMVITTTSAGTAGTFQGILVNAQTATSQ